MGAGIKNPAPIKRLLHLSKQGQACHSIGPRHGSLLRPLWWAWAEGDRHQPSRDGTPRAVPLSPGATPAPRILFPSFGRSSRLCRSEQAGARPSRGQRQPRSSGSRGASPARPYELSWVGTGPLWIGTGMEEGAETTSLPHTTRSEFKDVCPALLRYWSLLRWFQF